MSDQHAVQRSLWAKVPVRSRTGLISLSIVLTAVLVITLSPSPVDDGGRASVFEVLEVLYALGVPASFGYAQLEFAANIVMFMPLGLLFALCVSNRWVLALAFPPLLSLAIEMTQFALLPERFADVSDVVANSIGGWAGVGIAAFGVSVCNAIWPKGRVSVSRARTSETVSATP